MADFKMTLIYIIRCFSCSLSVLRTASSAPGAVRLNPNNILNPGKVF